MGTKFEALSAEQKPVLTLLLGQFRTALDEAHAARDSARVLGSGRAALIAETYNTSTDPEIVSAREGIAAAQAKIDAAIAALKERRAKVDSLIEANLPAAADPDEARRNAAEKKGAVVRASQGIEAFGFGEVLAEYMEENNLTMPGSMHGSSASQGTGIKRPRISAATLDGRPIVDNDGKVSFTLLAKEISRQTGIKVTPSDLSATAFAAAGTTDRLPAGELTFRHTVSGKKAGADFTHDYVITVTTAE